MNVSQYLASIGRKGGKSNSAAKTAAARANAKLGGRPKKKVRPNWKAYAKQRAINERFGDSDVEMI
jgi:hypothetical protein